MFVFIAPIKITLTDSKKTVNTEINETPDGPMFDADMDAFLLSLIEQRKLRKPTGIITTSSNVVKVTVTESTGILTISYTKV